MASSKNLEEQTVPFLQHSDDLQSSNQVLQYTNTTNNTNHGDDYDGELNTLVERVRLESNKLWHIVGPAIISRITGYGMLIATQAFAGHLGDLELAAFAIGINVVCGLDYGFLLGMASALETLCGQAFGAKRPYMLGVYLQRSWVVLFLCCILLLPLYIFATPMLKLLGQPDDVAELAGVVARWMLPFHFSLAFQFPLQRFLQCQLKTRVVACVSVIALLVHLFVSWLFVLVFKFGIIGVAITLNCGWWVMVIGLFSYTALGGCPQTWTGFSMEAFSGLWEFFKLSISSGVMLCLENWYYKILILMTGNLKNAKIALDALSICMNISSWEMMIPLAFFVGAGVRVANELGAGNGKGAKFATKVAVITSVAIGLFFWILVLFFHENIAYIFSTSPPVIEEVKKLSILLAFTILLNSVQPVLSGVAVGSGWQSTVAYINLGCYYLLGVPPGILLGWKYNQGVMGMWAGMIFGGTAVQTVILAIITMRCDWEKEAQRASMNVKKWAEKI
ncbi:protein DETOXIFICATION 27-like [Amaranthus tricolor]|uniref:protein DETOXIFICATION 27-like n=1 Tax=Amaranthus tricolor TaxID=29722 RepID=UPI00258E8DE2|nr:protein DETOXIFICATION 27-like [Amaranthus tricolor]